MHLGLQGQRHSDCSCYWPRCSRRPLGYFRSQEGGAYYGNCMTVTRLQSTYILFRNTSGVISLQELLVSLSYLLSSICPSSMSISRFLRSLVLGTVSWVPRFKKPWQAMKCCLIAKVNSFLLPPSYALVLTCIAEIHYYDTVTLRHKDTKMFLHSHVERYPLTYADGRVSSQGFIFLAIKYMGVALILVIRSTSHRLRP